MPSRLEARRHVQGHWGGVDLDDVRVAVRSPLLAQPLAVPQDVWLGDTPDGDADTPAGEAAICWRLPPDADRYGATQRWGAGGTGPQAFWAFLDLTDERRPERFVAFAKRFGVLGLWPYREPRGSKILGIDYWTPSSAEGIFTPHRYTDHARYSRLKAEGKCEEATRLREARYEPVAEWRRWATWFRAAVGIALELRANHPASQKDWKALEWDHLFDPDWTRAGSRNAIDVAFQKRQLAEVVQERFLKWSGLAPILRWGDDDRPSVALSLGGRDAVLMPRSSFQQYWPENVLYPALVAYLLAVVTAGPAGPIIAACDHCGRAHERPRRPRPDQPTRCPKCKRKATSERQARWRARASAAPQLDHRTDPRGGGRR